MNKKYCINCGREVHKNDAFCPYCGANLINTSSNTNKPNFANKKENIKNKLKGYQKKADNYRTNFSNQIEHQHQQTIAEFYSQHRVPIIFCLILIILFLIFVGGKFTLHAIHNYYYPKASVPPSMQYYNAPFEKRGHTRKLVVDFHKNTFDMKAWYDNFQKPNTSTFKIDHTSYSKHGHVVTVYDEMTGGNNSSNADYGAFIFHVDGNDNVTSIQPLDHIDGSFTVLTS